MNQGSSPTAKKSAWGSFKVKDFFSLCSWEGVENRSQKNYTQNIDWRSQTVKDFLSQGNWHGLTLTQSLTEIPENTLMLSVQEFFDLVNWESVPLIAPVAELNSFAHKTSEDNLTLNDLSDLF